jgi:3-phenylpropionate/cinnamic acid dioxygenase small subunit
MPNRKINQTETRIDEESHQRLADQLKRNMQIFDLKQLADMEATYRQNCKQAVIEYKNWERQYKDETDMLALLYGTIEGNMLRRRAEDSVGMYWTVRRDFRNWFNCYLAKTNCYSYKTKS